jgi:hypothetical protein
VNETQVGWVESNRNRARSVRDDELKRARLRALADGNSRYVIQYDIRVVSGELPSTWDSLDGGLRLALKLRNSGKRVVGDLKGNEDEAGYG